MSSVDLRTVPSRISTAATIAAPKTQRGKLLGFLGGFVLTGCFLALGAAVFAVAGVYSFIEFAKLY
jgi:hypothetical protein